ncbi:MAG: NAD+ synthase [Niastella sp.]|nr:NAD+ synthase [Niastella sp.]
MKIFLAQQNYHIGNIEDNSQKIITAIQQARHQGAQLVVFSELAVCGYPPRDFLYFKDFVQACDNAILKIAQYADGIAVLVGAPQVNEQIQGKDLYNAVYFLENKEIKQVIHKTCLPTYDVFDEDRYFEPATHWELINLKNKKIAVTICEDIWNLGDNPLYVDCPMDNLIKMKPDVMINLSASPFDYTHDEDRKAAVKANVTKYKLPLFYCNAVGSQTEIVFDGSSLVFDKESNLCGRLKSFEEDYQMFELMDDGSIHCPILEPAQNVPDKENNPALLDEKLHIDQVYRALVMGIKDYFDKMGFKKAIIGSSGGIDSAVTLCLACEALGAQNVLAVLMPSEYSTNHSVTDAETLSKNYSNPYKILPIKNIYESFLSELKPVFKNLPFSVAEENIQSRTRGNLLMAIANKFGYILLNTSNKSELATGYGTLYGDMAGGIGVLGDCYKLQIYELAKYINRNNEWIPNHIITKPPSAELRPGQKDSDSLPDYNILDKILYQYIEQSKGPVEIKAMGFEATLVDRVLKMVNINEYKRNQFCPIIRISPKAFGVGRRMPIVAKYLG